MITSLLQYNYETCTIQTGKYASLWHGMSYCSKKKSKRDKGKNLYVLYPSHGSFGPKMRERKCCKENINDNWWSAAGTEVISHQSYI